MGEKVIGVRIGETKGERKQPAPRVVLQQEHGVTGDAHAGSGQRQVSLLEAEFPVVRGKVGRPRGKYSDPQKPYVVSMRISDDEMLRIQEMMRATNKGASELMRAAFQLFKSEVIFNQTASAA